MLHWIGVFSRQLYRNILLDSIKYCRANKGLVVYAWVFMTNHLIIGANCKPMNDILKDLKKFTSVKIIEAIKKNINESRREWMLLG